MKSAKEWCEAMDKVGVYRTDVVEAIREEKGEACAQAYRDYGADEGWGPGDPKIEDAIRNAGKAVIKPGILVRPSASAPEYRRHERPFAWEKSDNVFEDYEPLAHDDIEWRGDGWYVKDRT